jgi:lipopolysaccharide biosynthesis regulator YciM
VASGLRMLALSTARYRCGNCGYGTQKFIWQCPSCKLWETIRPVQRFQLETAVG